MLSKVLTETFFKLIRLGLGNDSVGCVGGGSDIDWNALEALATQHGLLAIVVDAIEKLPCEQKPPKQVLLQWIGEVLQGYEYRYELYSRAIAEMASFYNSHGYKMMVLKGYACSLDWPKPEHRPCGDIDIWQFGRQKDADAALAKEKDVDVDNSHQHHTVFYWRDFMVENHYDFINVHHHKSNAAFEKILKELAQDDSLFVDVYGEKVYLPSPNLHALFLLKHMMMHFAAEGIKLRQLLDWAFFVKAHGKDVNWPWLEGVLDDFGMRRPYDIFNAICVEELGFKVRLFPRVQFESVLKERVLREILDPEFSGELPKSVFRRIAFKIRRWRENAWKHELCYKDSMWSAFWSGVWHHLQKPSSI